MIQETQLLKRMQQGEYSSLPKPVYHLAVLAAGNLLQKELVVRHSERPDGRKDCGRQCVAYRLECRGAENKTELHHGESAV